jgi:threonine dehydrogenase-like Zn-dependent dehydrogenase
MRSAILDAPGRLELASRPAPDDPGPGEVMVMPRCVGLCGTDYHAFAGRQNFFTYPRVLGHEIAAEVIALGRGVHRVAVGDRCAVLPYLPCGRCSACRRGATNCCEQLDLFGVTIDGGLSELLCVPEHTLYPCPTMTDPAIALIETLGVGLHAVERGALEHGEPALVVGAGPVGLAISQSALSRGAEVTIVDTNPARLKAAERLLGVRALIGHPDLEDDLRDLHAGELPLRVFEATGNPMSMQAAARFVGPTGTLILVGHSAGQISFDNPLLHKRELTIRTSRNALATEWPGLIAQVLAGDLDAAAWVNREMTLDDVPQRLPEWADPASGVLKGVVHVQRNGTTPSPP